LIVNFVGKVIIEALPPILTSGKVYEDVPALADQVRSIMVENYERITAELSAQEQ